MKIGLSIICCAASLFCLNSCITSALVGGATAATTAAASTAGATAANKGMSSLFSGITSLFSSDKPESMQGKVLKMKGVITRTDGSRTNDNAAYTFTTDNTAMLAVAGTEYKLTYESTGEQTAKATLATEPPVVYEMQFTDGTNGTYTYHRTEADGQVSLGAGSFSITEQ